jgi:hypothetical protein
MLELAGSATIRREKLEKWGSPAFGGAVFGRKIHAVPATIVASSPEGKKRAFRP